MTAATECSGLKPAVKCQPAPAAPWLEGPIEEIKTMALVSGTQLVLQRAGSAPNS